MLSPGEPLPDAPQPSASPNARFLAGTVRRGADERVRFGNSIIGSACTHIGGLLFAAFLIDNVQVREVKPSYTAEAMRAHVQGAVMVEAIVREDGSVGQVRIVRSLARAFGLDEEALRAVRNWRFRPGKREGQNVAVIVEIELMFTLR